MGKVYIVGAGPGDPDLLTIKALKAIEKADVILYDRLVNKEILQYAKEQADLIYCGKLPDFHTMKQETINRFLVKYAQKGKTVVRLKGGDPFVFGRGEKKRNVSLKTEFRLKSSPALRLESRQPLMPGFLLLIGRRALTSLL
ncbi:Siroheme synthase [Bacillus tequilensis]